MEAVTDLIKVDKDNESRDEAKRNILLETFDTIRDDLRRGSHLFAIKVRVVSGRQIQGSNISPKVCILFKTQKRWTQRDTRSTNEPFWGENFYFNCITDVEDLLRENVTFRVVNSRVLRRNLVIGEFQLSLVLVAGEKNRSMFNRWLALVDQNDPSSVCKGFLKVCVALIFPNEPEVHWPDPLSYDAVKEDTEVAVLTCSGHQFLKMTFIMAIYLMQDIPRYDYKGKKVTDVAISLSFAGNTVTSEPLSLPDEVVSEPYQIKKELRLTVSWPSMCDKLILTLFSVNGKEHWPLCNHTFFIRDIAVESYSALKQNVHSGMPQEENKIELDAEKAHRSPSTLRKAADKAKQRDKKKEGFMPMIGPCFVNMYGAPLDLMEDKVESGYIESMNAGVFEGCAFRGRMFVRLQSEFCDSTTENSEVKDLCIGTKEQRDLLLFAKSNTFLLFGMISSVPMISDAKCAMQFEISIGHNGLNSLAPITHAHPFPSTSFCVNPKEILKTQRILSGHSYSTMTLDNGKPAFLVESIWEDIRYRIHFYNFILFLENKWEKKKNTILMSYKLGLCRRRTLNSICSLCTDMHQCMDSTPIPANSSSEAGMNDMDRKWIEIRMQQLHRIRKKLISLHKCAASFLKASMRQIANVARLLCERLPDVSLLLDNIKKEPQLSIPDVFIYLLINNERRAYARVPVSSIYYCHADAVNPVDAMDKKQGDFTRYRGCNTNRMITVFLKTIPGLRGFNEDEYWPLPGMIRMKLLFGLASTMRNGVLPPIDYYGVIYEYTKLSSFMDSLCAGAQKSDSIMFKTDSSGINLVESSCGLLKAKPTQDRESGRASWKWKGNWMTWLDTSIFVNSTAETAFDFVYMVHMREKTQVKDSLPEWKFIGYFTEEMDRIVAAGNQLDKNFAMDTKKWTVILEKNPITGQELGWIEVNGSEEYCKDIHFCEKDITTTARLDSNFARKLLQRKRRRNDIVFTETITLTYSKLRSGNWTVSRICRFDGWKNIVDLNKDAIRCWSHMQNLTPMSLDLPAHAAPDDMQIGGDAENPKDSGNSFKTFTWIDDWQQLMLPLIKEDRYVDIVFERRKIFCEIINKEVDPTKENSEEFQRWSEFATSVTDGIFHLNQQKGDRVKRIRKRRQIEPTEVSLSLQSSKRDTVIKLAPFPTFTVQRRIGKRSRLCCLFDTIEHVPTPITVTAVVNTQHISRWEMRCYFHEARDIVTAAEDKNELYVYAILSISGSSAASAIIKNDSNTQIWRWNETIIFRNLVFHEHDHQVFSSPPMMVIEFFRKLAIHNDMFLGRCIIDSDNFVVQMENERHTEDQLPVLQWYKVHLRGIEDAGCVLAGFHFRCLNTLRPSNKIFENSILTPPEKNMEELFKQDRVVLDNRKRFEIPAEILPVLVPHVLKITSWGLRELRKYMLSRVNNPTIEFRIGNKVLRTETLNYEKSPSFLNRSLSLLIFLPLEISYLPELFMVVRDSRAFGRAPLIGTTRIPLHNCRFKDSAHLDELEPDEINFFMDAMCGNIRSTSNTENTYDTLYSPIKVDFSREFFFLFEPPAQLAFRRRVRMEDDGFIFREEEETKPLFTKLKSMLLSVFLITGPAKDVEDSQSANHDYKMVFGDNTLSKTKPDWWCKYYLSKTSSLTKAINYLEGDKMEFYYSKLEDAVVEIGESDGCFYNHNKFRKVCRILSSDLTDESGNEENFSLFHELQDDQQRRLYQVNYSGFEDVFELINLMRCNQMTSDEENRVCGIFLGKIRLYYLGPLVDPYQVEETMEQLYRAKTKQQILPYTQLYGTVPKEADQQDCLVRVYVVRALELQAANMSSLPNSYIEVFMADNKKETQLNSSKANSIEMDSNPVYGRMFELYCIVPFQSRLRVRIMDKSTFLFDEEIGSTTIDLEKRMTTIYRSTCGLPQCYRQAGINAWRDMDKPSEILSQVCRRFNLDEPYYFTEQDIESASDDGQEIQGMEQPKLLHRYYLFPPGCPKDMYKRRNTRLTHTSQSIGDMEEIMANSPVENVPAGESSGKTAPELPRPQDLKASFAFNEVINRRKSNKTETAFQDDSTPGNEHNTDEDPLVERIKQRVDIEKQKMPQPLPIIFRLEDFDAINEHRGIHLGPSDFEPEICRERLALNILRRLPLVREHVETRPLYSPLQPDIEQGRLEMWVDIFSLSGLKNTAGVSTTDRENKQLKAEEIISKLRELLPPPVNISPRDPQPYELRVVIWSVHDVIGDTDYGAGCTGDLYVRGWMEGLGDTQETDVHYNSLEGEGEFNWRFVFQLDYLPHERTICGKQKVSLFNRILTKIPPMLHLQLWDNRRFRFDDFIGSVEVDLSKLITPTRTKDSCFMRQRWGMDIDKMDQPMSANKKEDTVNLFEVQRVYGYWPLSTSKSIVLSENKPGAWMVGKLLMELEMLSKEEANLKPAGLGRGEPNQNPHLPDPKRLSLGTNFLATSLAAFRRVFWPQYKWYFIGGVLMIVFVALLVIVIVNTPLNTLVGDSPKTIG